MISARALSSFALRSSSLRTSASLYSRMTINSSGLPEAAGAGLRVSTNSRIVMRITLSGAGFLM